MKYCVDCGAPKPTASARCTLCQPEIGPARRREVRTWLGATLILFTGVVLGYYLGPTPVGRVSRAAEAVGDVVLSDRGALTTRARGELVRAELRRIVVLQDRFRAEHGSYRSQGELVIPDAFQTNYAERADGKGWMAEMRLADDGPRGIRCAVAVGDGVPAYIAGITLRRSGQVRCSRDLATRVNRFVTWVLPVAAWR